VSIVEPPSFRRRSRIAVGTNVFGYTSVNGELTTGGSGGAQAHLILDVTGYYI
jgi:hypothetical protein